MNNVDFDKIADLVGGALTGLPEESVIRHYLENDPLWSETYEQLVSATSQVHQDLARLAATPDPMPIDVVTRLDQVLKLPHTANNKIDKTKNEQNSPHHSWMPRFLSERWTTQHRWALGLTSVVAAIFAGFSAFMVLPNESTVPSTPRAAEGAIHRTSQPTPYLGTGPVLMRTGTNYTSSTVSTVLAGGVHGYQDPSFEDGAGRRTSPDSAPLDKAEERSGFSRLLDQTALTECLTGIVARHGGRVTAVDYARYNDRPALIVVLTNSRKYPNKNLIAVVGAACGTGNSIDEIYLTTA